MEIRIWCFIFVLMMALWFGHVSDMCKGGFRIKLAPFVQNLLFLKNDGQNNQLAVVMYQVYIEGVSVVGLIRIFINEQLVQSDFKVLLQCMAVGMIVLFVYEGLVKLKLELERVFERKE